MAGWTVRAPPARSPEAGRTPKLRVFFADEATAVRAGYRPCAVCMRAEYDAWKSKLGSDSN